MNSLEPRILRGVIAAIATPIGSDLAPDHEPFHALARALLSNGCDALNVLGTTGEAASFSLSQRVNLMRFAAETLPLDRLMVGTGAAAVADAVSLTRVAAELGFAGALVLPPFYYKGVGEDGVAAYVDQIVGATADAPIPIYLYNIPALSGIRYEPGWIAHLMQRHPGRVVGIKDSSGDLAYAREVAGLNERPAVFPANEATLLDARAGLWAGCISATANLNSHLCAKALGTGDENALQAAVAVRRLFDGHVLVPAVKALLAHVHGRPSLAETMPPLVKTAGGQLETLVLGYEALISPSFSL